VMMIYHHFLIFHGTVELWQSTSPCNGAQLPVQQIEDESQRLKFDVSIATPKKIEKSHLPKERRITCDLFGGYYILAAESHSRGAFLRSGRFSAVEGLLDFWPFGGQRTSGCKAYFCVWKIMGRWWGNSWDSGVTTNMIACMLIWSVP
jgi:hypothetical protein